MGGQNVGYRSVGSDYEAYDFHAADIAFAKFGHRNIYLKEAWVGMAALQTIKIEGKIYVVEDFAELTTGGIVRLRLHVPFEGSDVDGDSDEQSDLLQGISVAQFTVDSSGTYDDVSFVFFTDTDGTGAALDTGHDLDNSGSNEAKQPFLSGEYYLLETDVTNYQFDAVPPSTMVGDQGEYCLIYISSDQSSVDKTSSSSVDGAAAIGADLTTVDSYLGVQVSVASNGCPIGYNNIAYSTDGGTTFANGAAATVTGFYPVRLTRFKLSESYAVASKYQSTHAATGGAYLKTAYNRITSQVSRGTVRVYTTDGCKKVTGTQPACTAT